MTKQDLYGELCKVLDYDIIPITEDNFTDIHEVFDTNPNYFMAAGGKIADGDTILRCIKSSPPDYDAGKKLFAGLWCDKQPIAVLDLFPNLPGEGELWLGLLLVNGVMHGQKIGTKVTRSVITAADACGFKPIRLGVIQNNINAAIFWQKMGFTQERIADDIHVFIRK